MRLVGSTRNVSRLCNERFSWADGGGKLWRAKLGILAGMLKIHSLDEYAERFGSKWAYHLQPAIALIELPYYDDMKLAKLNGWDFENEQGEPWPWPDLTPPKQLVWKANLQAFGLAKEILLHRQGVRPDRDFKRCIPFKSKPEVDRLRPAFKSWLDYTARDN